MQLSKEKLYEIFVDNSRKIDTVSSPGECIFVGDLKSIVQQILAVQEMPDDTLPRLPQANVMRWVEFEKQLPPIKTLVACCYEGGRVDAGEFQTEDDVARHKDHNKPVAWLPLLLPPFA